jgi:flagellar biosynthesis/type III secretory pathway protein FliH
VREAGDRFGAADLGTVRSPLARDLVVDPDLVEHATEAGYRAGYDAGFTAGIEDAAAAIDSRERARGEQVRSVVERLAAEADTLAERHAAAVDQVATQIVQLAFDIAQTLVGRELRATDSAAADAIRRALELAPTTGPVVAHLHPDDVDALGDPACVVAGRALTIVTDRSLASGDTIVDVGPARVDARLAPAVQRIREMLES